MKESIWNGFKRLDFMFEGNEAILVFPNNPTKDKHWLFKVLYFDAFQDFELEMLERGWYLACVSGITRWCLEEDLDIRKRFATYLKEEFGLYEKCVPVGMSCGGLMATKLAAKYPEIISALYLDAPVMNFLSCPAGLGKGTTEMFEEFVDATGMDLIELLNYRDNPIDKKHILLENKIPIILIYGDSDDVVPYDENGEILEKYYRENGGTIVTIGKHCGHHPHGLADNTPLVEFVETYCK